jgi:hypothetical protein
MTQGMERYLPVLLFALGGAISFWGISYALTTPSYVSNVSVATATYGFLGFLFIGTGLWLMINKKEST